MINLSFLVIFNIWLCTLIMVQPYNLDVDNAKIFDIPKNVNHKRGSYFGFSVAFYKNGEHSILLVGAPRANTSATSRVNEPGCVYQCPIGSTCTEWNINNKNIRIQNAQEIKDNMWTGATIAVENKINPGIMVCAPRWKFSQANYYNYIPGICYWNTVKTVAPFTTKLEHQIYKTNERKIDTGYTSIFYYGMSQTGFSLHIPFNTSERMALLGSPGIMHWTGAIRITGPTEEVQTINLLKNSYDDLAGYAVTSGYYFGKPELWFASSAPKAANVYGYVIVFKLFNGTAIQKLFINGEQYGEYFGAILTSCDINNDGKDELIIGAPHWSKDVDEGRIYIYKAVHRDMFEKHTTFEGEISGGRFGTVATCLGDIDYDGYADFAVGAPYAEDTGAIYIFNGNRNGLIKRYSQKIIGKQFGENIRGFGISISEPRDMNNDMYPDIAVGAYLSEQAILINSKPAIILKTILNHTEEEKLLQNSTYFFINVCTTYMGKYSPKFLDVVHSLKIDQLYGRAFGDEQTLEKHIDGTYKFIQTVSIEQTVCSNRLKIHLKKNIRNIIDPLEVSTSVALEKDLQPKAKTATPDIFCKTCASINKFLSKTEHSIKLPFAVDCGEDNVCTSNVKIKLATNLKDNIYTVGSTDTVILMINAYNYDEPAYQLKVYLYIPQVLSLANVPPACAEGSQMHNTLEVICDVGNPLRENETVTLQLDMTEIRYDVKQTELTANFTMQSEQVDSLNQSDSLIIYFDADVDITIAGKAHDDLYSYYNDNEKHQLTSVQFEHIYEVQKFGVSPVETVILTVSIPSYWKQSAGDVHIVNLNKTNGYMDGQQFYCKHSNYTSSIPSISTSNIYSTNFSFNVQEFQGETNFSMSLPPMNRSLYLNCSNTNVHCTHLECTLGRFERYSSVARLSLTLDIYLTNFEPTVLKRKDIILFLSNGSVHIAQPPNITQRYDNKPDNAIVATMFLGSPVTEQLASWIIILSVILGIILLMFLIMGLVALGFFNREKREELKTLKSDMKDENAIIVSSSADREDIY